MAELTLRQRVETLEAEIGLNFYLKHYARFDFNLYSEQEIADKIEEIKNDMYNNVEYAVVKLKQLESIKCSYV